MTLATPAALLVTGTDTDVGKTVVGTGLLAAWRRRGHTVRAYKPVESGVETAPLDGKALWEATGRQHALREICPTWLAAPLAPPVAARLEGVPLDPDDWQRRVAALRPTADLLLVEAAGGLLSPLWEGGDAADLARRCDLPCLVVAPDKLGVINQVRLVVDALQHRQLVVAAVVLNRTAPGESDPSCATNRDEVARWVDVPVVGPLPYTADPAPDARADALLSCPGIEALLPG